MGEISRLDVFWRVQIRAAIGEKLYTMPAVFCKPLRRTLKGCWTLRVGDYRVIYQLKPRTVRIIAVIHRSHDYRGIERRL
jgi:mRNA-degrading endonuclease RelE of RelBE toxin-antitoxin system